MRDFKAMQALREGDLDKRGLGLSPAMLEAICVESETLQGVFELLVKELLSQRAKVNARKPVGPDVSAAVGGGASYGASSGGARGSAGDAPKVSSYRSFDWRLHALRSAVMYHLKESPHKATAADMWPEPKLDDYRAVDATGGGHGSGGGDDDVLEPAGPFFRGHLASPPGAVARGDVGALAALLLADERLLNDALETCRFLPTSGAFEDLGYRSEVWLGAAHHGGLLADPRSGDTSGGPSEDASGEGGARTLFSALALAASSVANKWELALSSGEADIAAALGGSPQPPSVAAFQTVFGKPLPRLPPFNSSETAVAAAAAATKAAAAARVAQGGDAEKAAQPRPADVSPEGKPEGSPAVALSPPAALALFGQRLIGALLIAVAVVAALAFYSVSGAAPLDALGGELFDARGK